jgi:membrane fusion protein, multidrug efflux system
MSKRAWVIAGAVALALVGAGVATRDVWSPYGAVAQAPRQQAQAARVVPVDIATAVKKPVPLRIEALGTVLPMASVAIKARVESMIVGVHFSDGASVKEGDVLFTLDSRAVEAQIRQVEAVLNGAKAQVEQAERDLQRYTDLLAKNATTQVNVSNAATQVNIFGAAVRSNTANLENLRVQLDYHTIRAAIPGRMSAANVKVGNFVRPADTAALATINQTKPVYVLFAVPQRSLPEVRQAMMAGTGQVEATAPGEGKPSSGRLTMIDNSVDITSGMVPVRATMDNEDEALWPGTLVNAALTLRVDEAVVVPAVAVQTGQSGTYVFVIKDGTATVRPVTVVRTLEGEAVIGDGVAGGETVVIDGQLLLANGTKVAPRQPRRAQAGS